MTDLVICMPVYNEDEGISEFISEIVDAFDSVNYKIVIVDDCSKDNTFLTLRQLNKKFPQKVVFLRNEVNLGHGPTTLNAINAAITFQPKYILTVDGDGQFYAIEMYKLYQAMVQSDFEVIDSIRINRKEPFYRKFVSFVTRVFVGSSTRSFVKDANSPLKCYKRETLASICKLIPIRNRTPNLLISILIRRRKNLKLGFMEVSFISRRGAEANGTMWQNKFKNLPNLKFLRFCLNALIDLLRFVKSINKS